MENEYQDYIIKIVGNLADKYDVEEGRDCIIDQTVEIFQEDKSIERFDLYFYDTFKALDKDMDIVDIADTFTQDVYDLAIVGQNQVDRLIEIDNPEFNCSFNFISIIYDSPLSDLKAFKLGLDYMLSLYKEQYGLVLVFVPNNVMLPEEWGYTRIHDNIINENNGNLYMKMA